jgi:hypothetical protein
MCKSSLQMSLIITIVYCLSYVGCGSRQKGNAAGEQYPIDRSDTVSVELQDMKDAKVIVYQTEPATVVVSYSHLIENLQGFIDQYNVADDITLLEKLRPAASKTDSVKIADFAEDARLVERFKYRLADMLEKGEVMIYHKNTGQKVESILVERFEFMVHKTAGRGGRRFYLPDRTLFLEVVDWMS